MIWLPNYGSQGGKCDGLKKNGTYFLIDLNAWSSGNGTLGRCGLVAKSVSLEIGFGGVKTLKPKLVSLSVFLFPVIADVDLSTASSALRLPSCCRAYCHDNELTL